MTLRDRLRGWRDRLLLDPRFHRWATAFPLTRPIARRESRALFDIEPQSSLARSFVRPVARKAAIRQDRPHIATEVDALRIARSIAAIPTRACDCDGDGSEQRDGVLHGQRTIARGRRADAAPLLTRAHAGRRP
jgi:hypothetical protein